MTNSSYKQSPLVTLFILPLQWCQVLRPELATSPAKRDHVIWLQIHRQTFAFHISKCVYCLFITHSWLHALRHHIGGYAPPTCLGADVSLFLCFSPQHNACHCVSPAKQAASSLLRRLRPWGPFTIPHSNQQLGGGCEHPEQLTYPRAYFPPSHQDSCPKEDVPLQPLVLQPTGSHGLALGK